MRCITDHPEVLQNKVALIRCDLNLPLSEGKLQDDTRIRLLTPLVDFCLKNGATVVLMSHFGNPKGEDPAYSMDKIIPFLPYPVTLLSEPKKPYGCHPRASEDPFSRNDAIDPHFREDDKTGKIYLLENLRFFPGEVSKDEIFAQQLASMGDLYINEAFSVCHRDHASITVLPTLLPAYAGPDLAKETAVMHQILSMKKRPIVFIVGGSKVSTKMPYLKDILGRVDYMIVGGLFAPMFLKVAGYDIGASLVDEAFMPLARALWEEYGEKIILPVDVVCHPCENEDLSLSVKVMDSYVREDDTYIIADLGPQTMAHITNLIHQSHMVIWNGVLGMVEHEEYRQATKQLIQAIRDTPHTQLIVGGGTTLAFIDLDMPQLHHVSSGGGAFLDYYAHGDLVGLSALIHVT